MSKSFRALKLLFTLLLANSAFADPNLVIHPVRLVFEANQRSATVDLSNSGDQAASYRITVENKRMDELGKFTNILENALTGELFANKLIQYSPRQVDLAPGASQVVRISLRKPADLAAGEYRSHLTLARIPDANTSSIEQTVKTGPNEIGIVLTALVGISIPVIVRHGDTSATANIANPKFRPATANEPPSVSFDLLRSGNASVYGDIVVDVVGKNASAKRVAVTSGIAVYSPNQVRKMTLALRPQEAIDFNKKTLSIKFKETGDQGKKVFAESELSVQ